MEKSKVTLSIIIVVFNEYDELAPCLKSLMGVIPKNNTEIIIVDNSTVSLPDKKILTLLSKFTYVKNKKNIGFARAANIGFRKAKGTYLFVATPDSRLEKNALETSISFLSSNSKIAAVGMKILSKNGSLQRSAFHSFPNLFTHFFEYCIPFQKLLNIFDSEFHPNLYRLKDHNRKLFPVAMIGAFFMMRKDAAKSVGYFSEDYFVYRDDTDICYKLRSKGYTLVFLPRRGMRHLGGSSWKNFTYAQCSEYYLKSTYIYYRLRRGIMYEYITFIVGLTSALISYPFILLSLLLMPGGRIASQKSCWERIISWHLKTIHESLP